MKSQIYLILFGILSIILLICILQISVIPKPVENLTNLLYYDILKTVVDKNIQTKNNIYGLLQKVQLLSETDQDNAITVIDNLIIKNINKPA